MAKKKKANIQKGRFTYQQFYQPKLILPLEGLLPMSGDIFENYDLGDLELLPASSR